jgi:hypothetical protein
MDHSAGLRGGVRSTFSREQCICRTLLTTLQKVVVRGPHEIRMVKGHMRTERGNHVACWSGFPLQYVHRFESLRLSDMSNCLFVAAIK